ncbi:MAG TPA: hypothetical protein VG245_03225, partial [Candidatus Dormibacteraeota bacterium]|nr:hypothetical protein [Candidatus Dormibacteraeota bacterium]
ERVLLTRQELLGELVVTLGGRAAETVIFGDPSTGAEDDIGRATSIAQNLAGRYGMSERVGPVRLLETEGSEFLGGSAVPTEIATGTVLAELHSEIRETIEAALDLATRTLTANRKTLETVVAALLEHESLEQEVLTEMLGGVPPLKVEFTPTYDRSNRNGRADLREKVTES